MGRLRQRSNLIFARNLFVRRYRWSQIHLLLVRTAEEFTDGSDRRASDARHAASNFTMKGYQRIAEKVRPYRRQGIGAEEIYEQYYADRASNHGSTPSLNAANQPTPVISHIDRIDIICELRKDGVNAMSLRHDIEFSH